MPVPSECRIARERGHTVVALVRHGQTEWNVTRRFLGATDLPLDSTGRAQARALGELFAGTFDRVYSSPLARARDTARELGSEPILVPELVEMSQGELEGLSRDEAITRFPGLFEALLADPAEMIPPGGENLTTVRDRAFRGLERVVRAEPVGSLLAFVSHQMVIASVSCTISGQPLDSWREHGVQNCAITFLAWDGDKFHPLVRGYRPEARTA